MTSVSLANRIPHDPKRLFRRHGVARHAKSARQQARADAFAVLDDFGFGYHGKDCLLTAFDAKKYFNGTVLANNSYAHGISECAIVSGATDFVSFCWPYVITLDAPGRSSRTYR